MSGATGTPTSVSMPAGNPALAERLRLLEQRVADQRVIADYGRAGEILGQAVSKSPNAGLIGRLFGMATGAWLGPR